MIDDKISADSHHYQQLNYSFTSLCISDKLLILVFFPFRENLNVNDALMELFILAYACKTACARRIIGMYMYFCQGSQICQIWRILRQNCSDDSTEVTEGVTSTPEIFGNKQGATSTPEISVTNTILSLSFFATNTIYVNCKRCKP